MVYTSVWCMLVYDVIHLWHHYDAVLKKSTGKNRYRSDSFSVRILVYSTGCMWTLQLKNCGSEIFPSVRIQYQYTGLVYSAVCMWTPLKSITQTNTNTTHESDENYLSAIPSPIFCIWPQYMTIKPFTTLHVNADQWAKVILTDHWCQNSLTVLKYSHKPTQYKTIHFYQTNYIVINKCAPYRGTLWMKTNIFYTFLFGFWWCFL